MENTMQHHPTTLISRVSCSSPLLPSPWKKKINSSVFSLLLHLNVFSFLFALLALKFLIKKAAGEISASLKPWDLERGKD